MNRYKRIGIIAILGLLIVVGVLALLGPVVGNVFSNVVFGLNTGSSENPSPSNVEFIPTNTPLLSSTPAQIQSTHIVQTVSVKPSSTPTSIPQPTETPTVHPTEESSNGESAEPEATLALDDVTAIATDGAGISPDDEVQETATALAELFEQTAEFSTPVGTLRGGGGGGSDEEDDNGTDVPYATSMPDHSLANIGNGSAYVFHDDTVKQEENTLIELQVFFDEYYITATPTSAVTALPASNLARPDIDPQAILTPRAARFTDDGIDLPEVLIAWLDCNDQFERCGNGGVLPMRIQSPNSWRWSITPKEGVKGVQDLRIELWTVDANIQRDQRIWTHDFKIGVDVDVLANSSNIVIAVLSGLIVVLLASFGVIRWREKRETHRKKPKIFISYRRLVSAGFGRAIHDALVTAGADVFIDIDDIHAGSFSEYIKDNIRERDYFVVLLAPKTLESKWVIQEILYAQEHNRMIIPVLLNDFDLYGDEIPDTLTFLQQQNAVTLPLEHFESGVNRIKVFIGLK